MLTVRYHRQLSRSIYIWGIFAPNDWTMIIALALNILILNSNCCMLIILGGYPAHLAGPFGSGARRAITRIIFAPSSCPGPSAPGGSRRPSAIHDRETHLKNSSGRMI